MDGFSGSACERLSCSDDCNKQGVCFSIKDLASRTRNVLSEKYTYTQPPLTMIAWDAEKIQGCNCDDFYFGYDCSQRHCPKGDDPLTPGQVNEVQLIKCTAVAGHFTLFYQGAPSTTIAYNANAAAVQTALMSIPEITAVKVTFSQGAHTAVCQPTNPNIISVEFTQQFGPQHPFVPYLDSTLTTAGGDVEVATAGETMVDAHGNVLVSVLGSKENDLCSGRGLCSRSDGLCACFDTNGDAYQSSNGYGGAGSRGDCGWAKSVTAFNPTASTCPGEVQCSGHGVCDALGSFRCSCSAGWQGGDCSEKVCPLGRSWFSYPTADNQAHNDYAECSNMGICDYNYGQCQCRENFYGEACEYMACGGGLANACSGHGRCQSMAELAYWADDNGDATEHVYGSDYNNFMTWDYDRVHGCKCDEGFNGYDCSLHQCPEGDDPGTYTDHHEVQLLQCIANDGNFSLSFRQAETRLLYADITAEGLQEALVELKTLLNVNVYFYKDMVPPNGTLYYQPQTKVPVNGEAPPAAGTNINGTFIPDLIYIAHNVNASTNSSFCHTDGSQVAIISFDYTHGDLPAIQVPIANKLKDFDNSNGVPGSGHISVYQDGGVVNGITSLKGTTEVDVCNGRGLCDTSNGRCQCFADWTSSDGAYRGGPGVTGDCGYRDNEQMVSSAYLHAT